MTGHPPETSEYTCTTRHHIRGVRIATAEQRAAMRPELRDVVEYRKSGLSLNHIVGCPLDCGYCVRHLFGNFAMKQPRALMNDRDAVDLLIGHRFFSRT